MSSPVVRASALPSCSRMRTLFGAANARDALFVGAKVYINFLSLSRSSGWLEGHQAKEGDDSLKASARQSLIGASDRYVKFSNLRRENKQAVPTRDISVIWSADLLRPQSRPIIGREEDSIGATSWYDHQHHRLLESGGLFAKADGTTFNPFTRPALKGRGR